MGNSKMAARKAEGNRSPQITVTLSEGCFADFEAIANSKKMRLGTFVANILESYHQSQDCASMLRRAKKTGDWADMEITDLVSKLPPSKREDAIALLTQLANEDD